MFRPNQDCHIQKSSGKNDVYGMPVPGAKVKERLAIIELNIASEKSAVRADTSASRGNAQEFEVISKFLLAKNTAAEINDILLYGGHGFRIKSLFPRHDLQGSLDHYEATCTFWSAR